MPAMKLTGLRQRRTDRAHRREIGQAGREQHVGARLLEGLQAPDRVVQIGLPRRKFSARAVSMKWNGSSRAAATAAATRSVAREKS